MDLTWSVGSETATVGGHSEGKCAGFEMGVWGQKVKLDGCERQHGCMLLVLGC